MTTEPISTNDSKSLSSFIWKIANDLWGDFKHTDFARIIIPLLLLRRLDVLLGPSKDNMLKESFFSAKTGLVRALTTLF